MKTIGIIGLGAFGRFAALLVPSDGKVRAVGFDVHPQADTPGIEQVDFGTVATADVVLLAVPLAAYSVVLTRLQSLLQPQTLVVDICSVKVRPQQLLEKHLGNHPNLLVTHPLFGPQSAAKSTKGHTLIVTKSVGQAAEVALTFCQQQLGLTVQRMTAEEHDRLMAQVHVLTFFVARGLKNAGLGELPFTTPSFQMLLDLVRLDQSHSDDLFRTIQQGNPFADETRQQLVRAFTDLEAELQASSQNSHGKTA